MNYEKLTDDVYRLTFRNKEEYAEIILLSLFPGVTLGLNDVHIHRIQGDADAIKIDYFRINYCFEGRCEVKLQDGRYVYVDNNALCMEEHAPQYDYHYPLGFYNGIQIFIDKAIFEKPPIETFELFGINLKSIKEKYIKKEETYIKIASDTFAKKSAQMVSIWKKEDLTIEQKVQQIRFILCQLFYYLEMDQAVNTDKPYNASILSHGQYMIAIDCERLITSDLSKKHTIEAMAADYKISPSSLKKFFSQVYGCSISEYTQTMRVKEAARLLVQEDLSIMQVAALVGYENQSKFSAVFKKHTGYAPLEYKRIHHLNFNK